MMTAAEAIRDAARVMPTINWTAKDPAEAQLEPIERRYYLANEQTAGIVGTVIRQGPVEAFADLT
jgi:hypothetical protein